MISLLESQRCWCCPSCQVYNKIHVPVNGPLLLKKAKSLSSALGDDSFTAMTGFIDRWKSRHGILMKKVCGEAGSV